MPYNPKQYKASETFAISSDDNIIDTEDKARIAAYDLYENLYLNALVSLSVVLRGEEQTPLLVPNAKKIIETTCRFLMVNPTYLIEAQGDEGTRQLLEFFWADFWRRENFTQKLTSNKRWGLVRGDAYFYVYARPEKRQLRRISVVELDPRNVFEIESAEDPMDIVGVHIVEQVQDLREPDKPDKVVVRRRTFRRVFGPDGEPTGVTSELKFFEKGKWDDRSVKGREKLEEITDAVFADQLEEEAPLPLPIVQLPVYKWRTRPMQNSTWGTSLVSGLETLLYGANQTLTDEDATLVFQGLGMYVTNAPAPLDPNTNQVTDWNIGPKQIIEIGQDQRFDRVTGVSDLAPFKQHADNIDIGITESSGTPQVAIGRVDVSIAESGIALQLQLMPLIAGNAEIELEMVSVFDQMLFDITTMWLPAYEPEVFGNAEIMAEMSVVTVVDDPMPKNRDAMIQEVVLLDTSNLILKSMTVAKLRELGWRYPTTNPETGEPLTDDDIAQMLLQQYTAQNAALDPFGGGFADEGAGEELPPEETPPDEQTVELGST